MPLPQQKLREIVFQVLYCKDFGCNDMGGVFAIIGPLFKVSKRAVKEAIERVGEIALHLQEIDGFIAKNSKEYSFDRITGIEKNILRLGVYELLYDQRIPKMGAIKEAVRLCRKFGTRDSAHFINAILDAIYHAKK